MEHQELLIVIVNDATLLDPILELFLEHEVKGATVVDSRGMANILMTEVPIFTGLKSLFPGGGAANHMVFSVMSSQKVEEIIPVINETFGEFDAPGIGFLFTVPVNRIQGFQSKK